MVINTIHQKPLIILIKNHIIDLNLYDLSFFSFIEYNQIYFINKFSGKTFNFNFLLPNEGKEYTIIRNNIIELLNPINLSEKLINEKKDKDTYMSS